MKTLSQLGKALKGYSPLPAGAIPLAEDKPGSMVCLMPTGRWVRWWPGTRSLESLPAKIQQAVMDVVVEQLGGTAAATAKNLGVSPRTVEAWRSGKAALPSKSAMGIAEALSLDR